MNFHVFASSKTDLEIEIQEIEYIYPTKKHFYPTMHDSVTSYEF